MSGARTAETSPPPVLEHPVMTAAQGLFLILNAASLRRLPMPFRASAYDYSPVVEFQFTTRAEVVTWAAAIDVAEVVDERVPYGDGDNDTTSFETTWLDVPIRCVASIPREPQ